jgi:hypothetical protein
MDLKLFFKTNYIQPWKKAWKSLNFKLNFFFSVILLGITLHMLTRFLLYVEIRNGIVLTDIVLDNIKPVDFTWFIFGIIYLGLFLAIIFLTQHPLRFLIALQSYTVMIIFRIIAMSLVPLNAPPGMIPLSDPFVQFWGIHTLLTKDLFFSGHTATLIIFFLVADKKWLKYIFLLGIILIAVFVIIQHVHYSIDVFTAPFFAYGSYKIVFKLNNKLNFN